MKNFIFILLSLFAFSSFAQQKFDPKDYAKKPLWIYMMNEPNINYYEVIKAYETFWSKHTLPEAEGDMNIDQPAKNKRRFSKKEVIDARQQAMMRMQIKKYKWWIARFEPYVQEDGTILRPTTND